jgi:hypothetical protein
MLYAVSLMNHAIEHKFALLPPAPGPPKTLPAEAFVEELNQSFVINAHNEMTKARQQLL